MTTTGPGLLRLLAVSVLLAVAPPAAVADPVVYAAGDIACDPTDPDFNGGAGTPSRCGQMRTSDLMVGTAFDAVLALGDLQYDAGNLANFQQSYDPSWGRVKSRTRPVIGDHEGTTATTGAGYCTYFGPAAHCNASNRQGGAAFYSFDVGSWHVVVVNSNCVAAGGCAVGSPQYEWLAADLSANPRTCTIAAWHHPRWSSGHGGNNAFMQPIWKLFYDRGGDLVLSGNSHDYERFAPIDGDGAVSASNGMRSFVVGTGGAFFTGVGGTPAAGSQVRQNDTFGVLKLDLHATSYDWTFLPEAGRTFTDSGSQSCRAGSGDTQAPSPGGGSGSGGGASSPPGTRPDGPLTTPSSTTANSTASLGPASPPTLLEALTKPITLRILAVQVGRGARSVIVRLTSSQALRSRVTATLRFSGRHGRRTSVRLSARRTALSRNATVRLAVPRRQWKALRKALRAPAGRRVRLAVTATSVGLASDPVRAKRTVTLSRRTRG